MRAALTLKGLRRARAAAARAFLAELQREARAEQAVVDREAALARRMEFARGTPSGFNLGGTA